MPIRDLARIVILRLRRPEGNKKPGRLITAGLPAVASRIFDRLSLKSHSSSSSLSHGLDFRSSSIFASDISVPGSDSSSLAAVSARLALIARH